MVVYNVIHDNFRGMQNRYVGANHYGGGMGPLHERYNGGYGCHPGAVMPFRRPRYAGGNADNGWWPCCSCGFWADPTC